jgi:hypothetical protein
MGFSPLNDQQQKRLISVAGDARWDERRSRRKMIVFLVVLLFMVTGASKPWDKKN